MCENQEAWELWSSIKTQWRVGFGGAVGLDYTAINIVAENLDIEINPAMHRKIQALEIYTLQYQQSQRKEGDDGSQ